MLSSCYSCRGLCCLYTVFVLRVVKIKCLGFVLHNTSNNHTHNDTAYATILCCAVVVPLDTCNFCVLWIRQQCNFIGFLWLWLSYHDITIELRGYYIVQLVGRNLGSRASVIASRETNNAGWVISWSQLRHIRIRHLWKVTR